jgi:hypothetical protein
MGAASQRQPAWVRGWLNMASCPTAEYLPFHQIEEDAYQEDLGFSLGHLGKSGSGRVRQTQVNEATKARISKTLQVWASPGEARA